MKNLLLAGAVAAALAGQARADDDVRMSSPRQFDQIYYDLIENMQKHNVAPQRACFSKYCQTFMVLTENGRTSTVYAIRLSSGVDVQEVCTGGDQTRRCWYSDGTVVDQTMNPSGDVWDVSRTLATAFP